MISSRSEYDFVEIADGLIVDGGIMPRRGGSSRMLLRAEDAAFCHEAVMERLYTVGRNTRTLKVDEVIRGTPLASCVDNLVSLTGRARLLVKPLIDIKSKMVDRTEDRDLPSQYYPEILFDYNMTGKATDFYPGMPLAIEPIMRLYNDISHINRFQGLSFDNSEDGEFSDVGSGKRPGGSSASIKGREILWHGANRANRKYEANENGWRTLSATSGDITIDEGASSMVYPIRLKYVSKAKIIIPIHVSYYKSYGNSTTSIIKTYLYVYNTRIYDFPIKISRSSLCKVATDAIVENFGNLLHDTDLPLPPDTQSYGNVFTASATIAPYVMMIVSLGDHTRF